MKPTKEQIDEAIVAAREWSFRQPAPTPTDLIIVALADQRAELLQVVEIMKHDAPVWSRLEEIATGLARTEDVLRSKQGLEISMLRDQRAELVALLGECIGVMQIQEKRESGEFHLTSEAFFPMLSRAKEEARVFLARIGVTP